MPRAIIIIGVIRVSSGASWLASISNPIHIPNIISATPTTIALFDIAWLG